jgi:adenosylhomocysteine nucleosidase
MSRFAIIAAFPGELKPLVSGSLGSGWKPLALRAGRKGDVAWRGRIGQTECVAVAAGMGAAAAARACALAEQEGPLDAVASTGWAGALSCGVFPGRAYTLTEVVDGESGERFPASLSAAASQGPLTLVTIGHVAQSQEKRPLAQHFQAVLVDMEGAAVARFARQKGIGFYCFKAVTDAYGEVLPDFGRYTDPEQKLRVSGLLAHVLLRPKYWRPMVRMAKNSRTGAEAIAKALREFIENAR